MLAIAWLAIWNTVTVILFPAILLLMGYVGELRFRKKIQDKDETDSPKKLPWSQIGVYAVAGLAAILATGYYVSYMPLPEFGVLQASPLELLVPNLDDILYTTSIAIAEEYFFRGFILDLLLSTTIPFGVLSPLVNNSYMKIALSAFIFMGYHWARYGTTVDSLIYVLVGGFALGLVNFLSKRVSPSILAHCANNLLVLWGI